MIMRHLFEQFVRETHWPSWLRGFSAAVFVWGIARGRFGVAVVGVLLFAAGYGLARYFPYTWVHQNDKS